MLKQMLFCTIIVSLTAIGSAKAQEPRDFAQLTVQTVQLPGTGYKVVFNTPELQVGERRATQPLLTAMVSWLGANFPLPAIRDLPRVELASVSDIADLQFNPRFSALAKQVGPQPPLPAHYLTLSLYRAQSKTIYLPTEWNGNNPAELSMLVKELVHHIQDVAGIEYECPQAREKMAYEAQEKWLGLFGSSLERDFEISPDILAAATHCTPMP